MIHNFYNIFISQKYSSHIYIYILVILGNLLFLFKEIRNNLFCILVSDFIVIQWEIYYMFRYTNLFF